MLQILNSGCTSSADDTSDDVKDLKSSPCEKAPHQSPRAEKPKSPTPHVAAANGRLTNNPSEDEDDPNYYIASDFNGKLYSSQSENCEENAVKLKSENSQQHKKASQQSKVKVNCSESESEKQYMDSELSGPTFDHEDDFWN